MTDNLTISQDWSLNLSTIELMPSEMTKAWGTCYYGYFRLIAFASTNLSRRHIISQSTADVLVCYDQCNQELADKISQNYKTVEAFLAVSSEDIAKALNLIRNAKKGTIDDARDFLKNHFERGS